MSKLYLSASNERGSKATKCANKSIDAHVSTWDNGIMINVEIVDGIVFFDVFKTNGSNGIKENFTKTKICSFTSEEYQNG